MYYRPGAVRWTNILSDQFNGKIASNSADFFLTQPENWLSQNLGQMVVCNRRKIAQKETLCSAKVTIMTFLGQEIIIEGSLQIS